MATIQKYSISQTAHILSLSKDTLRYYDKLGLVKPARGENRYRFYTEEDLLTLQYVEVMKFAGLSLAEIGLILKNRQGHSEANRQSTLALLRRRSVELARKIQLHQALLQMMALAVQTVEDKTCPADLAPVDEMVQTLYQSLNEEVHHEK